MKPAAKVKVGAEPKKVAILAVLLAVAAVVFYFNNSSSSVPSQSSSASRSPNAIALPPVRTATVSRGPDIRRDTRSIPGTNRGRSTQEFHPTLKPDKEDEVDYTKIDPTLRLDLLAKLQKVEVDGNSRSLFDFGKAPPPALAQLAKNQAPIKPGPLAPKPGDPAAKAAEPTKPPLPPIPLKFYGFVSPRQQGEKRAFFLEGDDIFVAAEGDTIKNRYKVIRIGVNSAVVEDTSNKNQQTLKLVEEATG